MLEMRVIFVLVTLSSLSAITVVTAQNTVVSVFRGASQTLACDHGASDVAAFVWRKGESTILINGIVNSGQPVIAVDSDPDKTELLFQDGNPNMRLDNIDISDEAVYQCEVTPVSGAQEVERVELYVRVQPTTPTIQVQYDPPAADTSSVPLNTTVTFTCTSTGGRPPASLAWTGTPVSVTPTYTSTNDSQGVGDAMSTFNFTTTEYSVTYDIVCEASGPSPIETRRDTASFTTEPDPSVTTSTPQGQTGDTNTTPATQTGAGISDGAIAGIVIGVIAALALTAALVYFLLIREKKPGKGKEDGVESGDADVTYHATGHPGAPENLSRPPPNQPEVMYAELDLEKQPAGSRRPYVATTEDPPTEYASIRPNKPPRSSVPHTLAPDEKSEYASVSKPGTRY